MEYELVEDNLSRLDGRKKAAFAAAMCERAKQLGTKLFKTQSNERIIAVQEETLNKIWEFAAVGKVSNIVDVVSSLKTSLPDIDAYNSPESEWASYAQNYIAALINILHFCERVDLQGVVKARRLIFDSIDLWLHSRLFTNGQDKTVARGLETYSLSDLRASLVKQQQEQDRQKRESAVFLREMKNQISDINELLEQELTSELLLSIRSRACRFPAIDV